MRVFGIDCGTEFTGYGVVEVDCESAMIARISIATRISTKVNPEFARNLTVGSFTAWPEEWASAVPASVVPASE